MSQVKSVSFQKGLSEQGPTSVLGFNQSWFENLIEQKGYNVIHEKALQCPCKGKGTNALSTCKNCGSCGWIFVNPYSTRMILHSMNQDTQFKDWGQENLGTVHISVKNADRLCYMDRITLIDSTADFNEVRHFRRSDDGVLFTYCSYHIKEVNYAGLFLSDSEQLKKLVENTDFTFDGNKIFLNSSYDAFWDEENPFSITLRYVHQPQYHVIDLSRQVANSRIDILDKKAQMVDLPLAAVGRRAHFVLDTENISFTRLLNNSYNDRGCSTIIKQVDGSFSKLC